MGSSVAIALTDGLPWQSHGTVNRAGGTSEVRWQRNRMVALVAGVVIGWLKGVSEVLKDC